ncbi:MAG: sigma-70 family RNA polymerase sigma factor [Candidatus Andersenbacteria bacterium]
MEKRVVAAQAGSRTAFDELVKEHSGLMHDAVRKHVTAWHDVKDLVQEACLQAWYRLWQLRQPTKFPGWLYKIARNQARSWVSRHPMEVTVGDVLQSLALEHHIRQPNDAVLAEERADRVRQALGCLKDPDRAILQDFYFNGCSLKEMSLRNEAPLGTIKRRLHVARRRFKEVF